MGLIAGLTLTGLVIYAAYHFLVGGEERAKLIDEFKSAPAESTLTIIWLAFILLFFWGLIVPSIGRLHVNIGIPLELWQLGGIGFLAGFVLIPLARKRKKTK